MKSRKHVFYKEAGVYSYNHTGNYYIKEDRVIEILTRCNYDIEKFFVAYCNFMADKHLVGINTIAASRRNLISLWKLNLILRNLGIFLELDTPHNFSISITPRQF